MILAALFAVSCGGEARDGRLPPLDGDWGPASAANFEPPAFAEVFGDYAACRDRACERIEFEGVLRLDRDGFVYAVAEDFRGPFGRERFCHLNSGVEFWVEAHRVFLVGAGTNGWLEARGDRLEVVERLGNSDGPPAFQRLETPLPSRPCVVRRSEGDGF